MKLRIYALLAIFVLFGAGCFPGADNTGSRDPLTTYTGNYEFRTDGEVVENMLFLIPHDTGVYVAADNVTFRNCKFVMQGNLPDPNNPTDPDAVTTFTMMLVQGVGTHLTDVEFDGRDVVERAIEADNDTLDAGVTVLRANIHNAGNGIESQGPLDVRESYIHDIWEPPTTDWHADGIQTPRSSDDITIVHNTILTKVPGKDNPATSAINVQGSDTDPAERVLVDNNLLGGGGFTLYAGPGGADGNEYVVTNNHFTSIVYPPAEGEAPTYGNFGPITTDFGFANTVFSGNVDEETGDPVNPLGG